MRLLLKSENVSQITGTLNIHRDLAQPGIRAIGELHARGHTIMPHTATALTQGVWANNPVNMDNLAISTTCQEGAEIPQQYQQQHQLAQTEGKRF